MSAAEPAAEQPWTPVQAEQLEQLVRTTPWAWLLSMLSAGICYVQYAGTDSRWLMVWLAAFCVVSGARLLAALCAIHLRPAWLAGGTSGRVWLASTLVHAAQWGLLSLVLFEPGQAEADAILHITLAGVILGGSVRLPGFPGVLKAHVLLVLMPLLARDLLSGQPNLALMALLMLLIGIFALLSGRNQSNALVEIHRQRQRNAELIEALQRENERSEAALRSAEEAGAARTRFFAAANHDLRQPLHAMSLLLQTLLDRDQRPRDEETVRQLTNCVDGMAEVVDGLLEITRLDGGRMTAQWQVFDADEVIRDCCRPYEAAARSKGLQLRLRTQPHRVRSDRALLARVLSNLVANAIRYTPQGTVTVSATAVGSRLRVGVEDTGIGIDAAHLPHIFEEFYQVANPSRDRRLGLGLGLATVKRLSDLLGLEISVESALGRGSLFSFVLPIVDEAAQATAEAVPDDGSLLAVRRVLVIEDDIDSRDALVALLRTWGCEVQAAPDLAAAIEHIGAGFTPEAAVVDLRLPGGASGLDAVRTLRERFGVLWPAVIVTGDASQAGALRAQPDSPAVMVKPVRPLQLRAFLSQSLSRPA